MDVGRSGPVAHGVLELAGPEEDPDEEYEYEVLSVQGAVDVVVTVAVEPAGTRSVNVIFPMTESLVEAVPMP